MIELNRGDMEQFAEFHTGYSEKKKRSAWAAIAGWDKFLLFLLFVSISSAVIALFILFTPVLDIILDFMGLHYSAWNEWKNWIAVGNRGLVIAAAFGLTALLFALLARFRFRRIWSVYAEAGCPQCHEHELIRVRRNRRDRVLSFFGVSVRRYSCRNCTWHGVRLAGYRYAKNVDESEEFAMGEAEIDISGEQIEPLDAAIGPMEALPAPAPTAKIMMMGLEDASEMGSPTVEELPFEFVETAVIADVTNDAEFASEVTDAECGEDAEVEMPIEFDSENGEVQLELAEEMVDGDDGAETSTEDDEFDRLCLEVALARK